MQKALCVCVRERDRQRDREKERDRENEREINVLASGKYQVSKNVNIINESQSRWIKSDLFF